MYRIVGHSCKRSFTHATHILNDHNRLRCHKLDSTLLFLNFCKLDDKPDNIT